MKKSTKMLLMFALVLTISGTAFGIVSLCTGFRVSEFREVYAAGDLHLMLPKRWKQDLQNFASDVQSSGADFDQTYAAVKSLQLDVGTADCIILPSEWKSWRVIGDSVPSYFSCEQKGDTLKIGAKRGIWSFLKSIFPEIHDTRIEIWIPRDQLVKKIKIDAGVGDLKMPDGMIRCEKMEIDCGVGDSQIWADITEKLEIDGGVGNLDIELFGQEEDFDYDIDNGVGSVTIGEQQFSSLGGETKLNNNAGKKVKIDAGVGDVEVQFSEDAGY